MAKPSTMIAINADKLRNAVEKRGIPVASLEKPLGVTRQAINSWLQQNRIPPLQLERIADHLDLEPEEIDEITKAPEDGLSVLFRTNRNVAAPESIRAGVREIAEDFFQLQEITSSCCPKAAIQINAADPRVMAEHILRELKLTREQLTLGSVVLALELMNIHVLFFDFGEDFVANKAQAASVWGKDRAVIFVNSYEAIEDVLWRIFHEVCHIFSRHRQCSKAEEEFCNAVASEIVVPSSFFIENSKMLEPIFSGPPRRALVLTQEIAKNLGASIQQILIGLTKHNLVSQSVKNYLWKCIQNQEKHRLKVHDVITPTHPDAVGFYMKALSNPSERKFFKLQSAVKAALLLDKITIQRAAELLKVDVMTAQELSTKWQAEELAVILS